MTTNATNDTLDEIEARWENAPFTLSDRKPTIEELEAILQSEPQGKITIEPNGEVTVEPWTSKQAADDIRTLIEMVRARDRVVEAAKAMRVAALSRRDGSMGLVYAFDVALAALDTPPAQEPGER